MLSENEASQGGAIYNAQPSEGGSAITISGGSRLEENDADQDGAGIYNDSGPIIIDGSSVVRNTAKGNGGGIYNSGLVGTATLTIQNVEPEVLFTSHFIR